jgi:integrase
MRRYQRGWIEKQGARGNQVYVGRWRSDDGTKPKLSIGFCSDMSLSQARDKIEAHVRSLGSRPTTSLNPTLSQYWTIQYMPARQMRWSEPTKHGYEGYFNWYLKPTFGALRVCDIERPLISGFFDEFRKKYSRSVVIKVWVMLKAILENAVDDNVIEKSPMRKLQPPKTLAPLKPTMSKDLLAAVLRKASAWGSKVKAIIHIGVFCAVRPAEVFGLRWCYFFEDHFLIRDSAWHGKLLQDSGGKTGERKVAIPPSTLAALLEWRAESKFSEPTDLIFPSQEGTPISTHNFRNRVLVPIQEELKLTVPLTFQVLRRSHATRNQARPKDVQSHLGHKSIVTTMNVYAQEIPSSVREMIATDEKDVLGALKKRPAPKLPPNGKRRKSATA